VRAIVSEYSYAQSLVDDLYNPNKPPLFASTAIAFGADAVVDRRGRYAEA